jgi:N-acetylneuraminate synthase/N,N'-diacetyllegionaminate synthase
VDRVVRVAIEVGGRRIGPGAPCFVIAEAGVNHNGDLALAKRLVEEAAKAGADAVKFQTFNPARLASAQAPKAEYQRRDAATDSQREMLERLTLSADAHRTLKHHAKELGISFLSSPFEEESADLLEALGVPAFKVPSGELTNHAFLANLAARRRPLLVSTGMATLAEVAEAVEVIRGAGNPPLALFHCVSSYPASPSDANLRSMSTLREAFGAPVGWSDHMPGLEVALAAVALGADMVEKHLTLDRSLPGPDHRASLEPEELAQLVRGVRTVTAALGRPEKHPVPAEAPVAAVARKSLHWSRSLPKGARVEPEHLVALRPGTGIAPGRLRALVGRRTRQAIEEGQPVLEHDLEELT